MSESSKRRRLFEAVMSHPASERRAVLERLCAGTPDLVEQVWAMIVASERSAAAPGDPVAIVARAAELASRSAASGDQVGRYRLVEPIGEGGFGEVWTAQQSGGLERLVAVKILKPGMDSRQVVARFEQERQALALMEHPHIARVFDAGTTADGRPFFAMELVKGLPVTDYCTVNGLDLEARLEVFSQVCHAVQHAHAKGVIHRDIKPSNVLVETHDGRPCAKVIDFGIAKAIGQALTDKSIFTAHAAMVGTLEYMSPEQADGALDIDIRSDVYSLGALLYELLTGEPPVTAGEDFQALGLAGLLEALREREPERPSVRISKQGTAAWRQGTAPGPATRRSDAALAGILARDLDWVVMKALEKDRGRRYPTAHALAEDLRRYRDGEALVAVPPSVGYRVRKFVRRRRHGVIATAAVTVASLLWLVLFLRAEGRRAEQELKRVAIEAEFDAKRSETEFTSYTLALASAAQASVAGERSMALEQLNAARIELRDWEWKIGMARTADAPIIVRSWVEGFSLSSSGEWAAGVAKDGLQIFDTCSGQLAECIPIPTSTRSEPEYLGLQEWQVEPSAQVRFLSGEGLVLVYQSDWGLGGGPRCGVVRRASVDGEAGLVWSRESGGDVEPIVLNGSSELVVISSSLDLECLDSATGELVWTTGKTGGQMKAWTDAGDHILALDEQSIRAIAKDTGIALWVANLSDIAGQARCDVEQLSNLELMAVAGEAGKAFFLEDYFAIAHAPSFDGLELEISNGAVRWQSWVNNMHSFVQDGIENFVGGLTRDGSDSAVRPGVVFRALRMMLQRNGQEDRMVRMVTRPESQASERSVRQGELGCIHPVNYAVVKFGVLRGDEDREYSTLTGDLLGVPEFTIPMHVRAVTGGPYRAYIPRSARYDRGVDGKSLNRAIGGPVIMSGRPPFYCPGEPGGHCLAISFRSGGHVRSAYSDCWVTFDPYTGVRLVTDDLTPAPRRAAGSDGGRHLVVDTAKGLYLVAVDPEHALPLAAVEGDIHAIAATDHGPRAAAVVLPRDRGASLVEWGADGELLARRPVPAEEVLEDSVLALTAGRVALGTRAGHVLLWNGEDAAPSRSLEWPGVGVHSLAFCRTGATLAVGLSDGSIATVDTATGRELLCFSMHIGPVRALAWSASNRRLFSAGEDRFVRVLEASSGRMVLDLGNAAIPGKPTRRYYDGRATCLLATPDGERLIAGFDDGAIRVWDAVPWKQRYAELQARKR